MAVLLIMALHGNTFECDTPLAVIEGFHVVLSTPPPFETKIYFHLDVCINLDKLAKRAILYKI